jgi:hypothetical protein
MAESRARKDRSFPEGALQATRDRRPPDRHRAAQGQVARVVWSGNHLNDASVKLSGLDLRDVRRTVVRSRVCPHKRRKKDAAIEDGGNQASS